MRLVHELAVSLLSLFTVAAGVAIAEQQSSRKTVSGQMSSAQLPAKLKENEIARGRYLVEEVARCPDCHTPRDSEGRLDRTHWLQGAPIWIRPVQSKEAWAMQAPALAGFPYSDQQAQDILERGLGTNGIPIQPPMHAYHLQHADAVTIIAYLRSLSRAK
jgi:hypothetical protein